MRSNTTNHAAGTGNAARISLPQAVRYGLSRGYLSNEKGLRCGPFRYGTLYAMIETKL